MGECDKTEIFNRLRDLETKIARYEVLHETIDHKLDAIKDAADRDRETVQGDVQALMQHTWTVKGAFLFLGALATVVAIASGIAGIIVALAGQA